MKELHKNKGTVCIVLALAFLVGLWRSSELQAQAFDTASVYITGKVCKNEVWLRWAASSSALWEESLQKGWTLERYDFDTLKMMESARKNLAYVPARQTIIIPPFMQFDTARLSAMANTDIYAAVLGEAVHSPDLALSMGGIALSSWDYIAKELERKQLRFVMANLAYDRSFSVACAGSMGYIDRQTEKGHFYLYRLYSDFSDTLSGTFDTALYFTRLEPGLMNPPLQEIKIETEYRFARLEWDVRFAEKRSVGYYVERAVASRKDGDQKYERLNQTPLNILQQQQSFLMAYKDSLPDTEKSYVYRVVGVDLFGEEFPVAQSRLCKSGNPPLDVAVIDSVASDAKGRKFLYWSYPQESLAYVRNFSLYLTSQPDWDEGKAVWVSSQIPSSSYRYSLDAVPMGVSSYVYVKTFGKDGQSTLSRPYFYWKKDSIPPLPPQSLSYTVDSAGVVCINWRPALDKDLAGYRVFCRYGREAEPVQVTTKTITDTLFYDTISLKTPQYFYYSIRSVDVSGNISQHSEWLAVKNLLPDKPAPAIFSRKSKNLDDKVELVWYNSSSSCLRGHKLLYKVDSFSWFLLKDFPKNDDYGKNPEESSFIFSLPKRLYTTKYTFNIVAYGPDSEKDTVHTPFEYVFTYVPELNVPTPIAIVDRDNRYVQLQWKAGHKPVRRLFLYRCSENDKLRLLATLDPEQVQAGYYTDFSVKINTDYTYVIQFEYQDGLWSSYSRPCEVNY